MNPRTHREEPDASTCCALTALNTYSTLLPSLKPFRKSYPSWSSIPRTTPERLAQSWSEQSTTTTAANANPYHSPPPTDEDKPERPETYLYLAYGSNLSAETFLGRRGIRPLSAINVAVPSLRLTFDLPGIPYSEPCFANSGSRNLDEDDKQPPLPTTSSPFSLSEKSPLLPSNENNNNKDYNKNHWHKPLIGVVYEVTPTDYFHIISTEGGGASYQDIQIPCHPLVPKVPVVPQHPTTTPFLAHTLFAPPIVDPPGDGDRTDTGRLRRPDPSYAQPSPRYLNLITSGAAEHNLPAEYTHYLSQIRPYTKTTPGQRLGAFIFLSIWLPVVMFLFKTGEMFRDERGRAPEWWVRMAAGVFAGVWGCYDGGFGGVFGDGERTVEDGGHAPEDGEGDGEKDGQAGVEEKGKTYVERAKAVGFIQGKDVSGMV